MLAMTKNTVHGLITATLGSTLEDSSDDFPDRIRNGLDQ